MFRKTTLTIGIALLIGCGPVDEKDGNNGVDEEPNDETCALQISLGGTVTKDLDWNSQNGCGGATSGSLVTMTFGVLGDETVFIGGSGAAGELATDVDAYVTYRAGEDEWTAQDCTYDVTRNELVESDPEFGDQYAMAGEGSCSGIATPTGGDAEGELEVGDFTFALELPW